MGESEATAAKAVRRFPVLEGVLPVDRKRVPTDIIAGVTLAALAIPEVMGYTKIAGMPVITGLYTILIPIAVFALLGSSRHLVVGADSATAAIMFAGLAGLAKPDSPQWVALAGWLAIVAAAFLVAARVLRLGFLADFLSSTVLIGFLTGVGIQVSCEQIAGMLGVTKTGHGPLVQAFNALKDVPQANLPTVAVSASVLVVIVGSRLIDRRIPGPLIAVVGAIAASAYLGLSALGVSTLGAVPSGLPAIGLQPLPNQDQWWALVTTGASLFLVILAQSAATSRAYAVRYQESFSENTDLVGLSLANVAAGFTGTFVVNGSPTKTQMVDSAGGRSQIAQLTTAVITAMVLLFLTKPLSFMPNAVLASVVFLIGVELVDIRGMVGVWRSRPAEFWVAVITAATVVIVGVEQGILLAIALSLIVHVRHSYRPNDLLVEYHDGEAKLHPLKARVETEPGLVVYHFGASLYYANVDAFNREVLGLVDAMKPQWLAVEASAIGDIDYTAAASIRSLVPLLASRGVTLVWVDPTPHVDQQLTAAGMDGAVRRDAIHPSMRDLIDAYHRSSEASGQG